MLTSVFNILETEKPRRRSKNDRFACTPLRFAVAVTSPNIPAIAFFHKKREKRILAFTDPFFSPRRARKLPIDGCPPKMSAHLSCCGCRRSFLSIPPVSKVSPCCRVCEQRSARCPSCVSMVLFRWRGPKNDPLNVDQNLLPKV